MRDRCVLVYGEMDVHTIDGSSIWLVSTVEVIRRAGCRVVLLLRLPPRSDRLLRALGHLDGITVIDPSAHPQLRQSASLKSSRGLSAEDAALAIEYLAASMAVDAALIRGSATARRLSASVALRGRLWPYLTDIPQSVGLLDAEHRSWLSELAAASAVMLCQTEGIRALLESCVRGAAGKCELWPPMVPDLPVSAQSPEREVGTRDRPIRLGYMGKFAPLWNTREMMDLPSLLRERGLHATLDAVGDKVHPVPERPGWRDDMRRALASSEGVTWHGGVPREEALRVVAACHLGLSWRSHELDGSLELSTKLLEYGAMGLPAVVNRTFAHEELLGKDYPFFVDERNTVLDAIERAARNLGDLHAAAGRMKRATGEFRMDRAAVRVRGIFDRVLPDVAGINPGRGARTRRPRIAIAGHDLKFMERLAARIEGSGAFEIRWDRRGGGQEKETDAGRECLKWADLVICEWCGGNAVWYSRHLRPSQGLIVRLHRYELERPWPRRISHGKVDRLICVSHHTASKAVELMPELSDRTDVIPNWVDVEQLDRGKLQGAEFTIGLLGASVPRKGLMRALDIVEQVRAREPRFRLSIKSELPWRLPWWRQREHDRAYFVSTMARISESPLLRGAVTFEEPGGDVACWFRKVGWILSTSDDESFHLAPAEGAASGAVPVILDWTGAAEVHGGDWVHASTERAAQWILDRHADGSWAMHGHRARAHVRARYALEDVAAQWTRLISEAVGSGLIAGRGGGRVRVPAGPRAPAIDAMSGAVWRLSRRADQRVHEWFPRKAQSVLARGLRHVARTVSGRLRPRQSGFVLSDYGVWIRECPADVTFRMCLLGTYGSALTDLLDMQEEPFRFLDVGANIGIFSLVALQNAQCVGVDAYEPDPATLPMLRANLERSGRSDWRIHPFALSKEPGRAEMARIPGHSGGSSIVRPAAEGQEKVSVTCVDGTHLLELVGAESSRLIVKMDVEGAEHLALAGLLPHLGSRTSMLWVECSRHSDRSAATALLHEHGFAEAARIGESHLYDALWMPTGMHPPQAWLRRFAV